MSFCSSFKVLNEKGFWPCLCLLSMSQGKVNAERFLPCLCDPAEVEVAAPAPGFSSSHSSKLSLGTLDQPQNWKLLQCNFSMPWCPKVISWFKASVLTMTHLQSYCRLLLFDQQRQKCRLLSFLHVHFPQTMEKQHQSVFQKASTWWSSTWTSDTMIPDSKTVPQAVQTESALWVEIFL